MVYLLSRRACKDESQTQGQVEEEIGHDQYPDGQVEGASFVVREEDGLDLMQQHVFEWKHGHAVHDLCDILVL